MKNRRNSLRQIIESTINAWCCCDIPESELEQKIISLEIALRHESKWVETFQKAHLKSLQEILGHEVALDIERRAWASKFFELTNKITAQESVLYEVDKRRIELINLSEKRRIQLIVVSAALFAVSVLAIVEMCGGVA